VLAAGADAIYLPAQGKLGPQALQLLKHDFKVSVPAAVSLISGEHHGWSELFTPPLTTVDAPLASLADRSVQHMLNLIQHKPTERTEVMIATPIIERGSVLMRGQKIGKSRNRKIGKQETAAELG
jgi:hypothetical protein